MILTLTFQQPQHPPGAVTAPGDTLLHGLDTLAGAATALRDTLSQAPLPGGVATAVRFLFQLPQWVQIGGMATGALIGLALVVLLWRRRRAIWTWFRTRARQVQLGLAAVALVVLALAAFGGMKSWNYMQHDNSFCTGCHIMERPFRRFEAGAGKHDTLLCHDCHQQSLYASTRQLVLWVADRPQKIGVHAPVPNFRCEACHMQPGGKKPFQHALYLAGHKVHFESDSAPLQNLSCAKCHGAEIHRFVPSAGACQQSGCHENQSVRLGVMAKLPAIKCTTCHAFTADIPALATRDSAVHAMIPTVLQCRSCHGMATKPTGYDITRDPHKGSCGTCHDVHRDSVPSDAKARCATCHQQDVARNAFHNGANHKRIQAQCLTCHQPHAASLDASDCVGCHTAVQRRGQFHPPLPFDTNSVVHRRSGTAAVAAPPPDDDGPDHRGKGDALPDDAPPGSAPESTPAPPAPPPPPHTDSFPHSRHTSLACLTCHVVNDTRHLVFEVPRGCTLCHHQNIIAGKVEASDCRRCHDPEARHPAINETVAIAVKGAAPKAREVAFRHEVHRATPCATCHQAPNTTPPDSIRTCRACHADHHAAGRSCTTCHNLPGTAAAHSLATHVACDQCHTRSRVAALTPTRTFCVTCHAAQANHKPGQECSTCHFLETPDRFRARLVSGT